MAFLDLPGDIVAVEALRLPKAQNIAELVSQVRPYPFVSLVECRAVSEEPAREIVVLDLDVEVAQRPVHDIRRTERIAAVIYKNDQAQPEALALRDDFPLVPHLNLRAEELPRSLCLTDQPYEELRSSWTASSFVERIRGWLRDTASGTLHQDDQPLEPLLGGASGKIILPSSMFSGDAPSQLLTCYLTDGDAETGRGMVVVASQEPMPSMPQGKRRFVAVPLTVETPLTHGVMRRQPSDLADLHSFLEMAAFDLLTALRDRLKAIPLTDSQQDALPILVIGLLKRRTPDGPPEAPEVWAFMTNKTLREVGEAIGVYSKEAGSWGLLLAADTSRDGTAVELMMLLPYEALTVEAAARYSGSARYAGSIVAVGLGAIGSQVFDILMRSGFGQWTLVDHDHLLPHNLVRHALHGDAVGHAKVLPLAAYANETFDGNDVAVGIPTNILSPRNDAQELERRFGQADLILDMSASGAVARHLASDSVTAEARRVSLFLNPTGSDLVILAEDAQRRLRLDALEAQYYRAIVRQPELRDHLVPEDGKVRIGRSCRDTSIVMPQDQVALHAAVSARAVRRLVDDPAPSIRIWRMSDTTLEVRCVRVDPQPSIEVLAGTWTVCFDEETLYRVRSQRRERLPNETGGVLVGSFDMERKIIYIADVIPSPPDSVEEPTLYIRGYEGLRDRVNYVSAMTAGQLMYAGEWHSHPAGYSAQYSSDDRRLFQWLEDEMAPAGHPPVMLIVGEQEYRWYVERLPE